MSKKNAIISIVVLIAILALGGWYLAKTSGEQQGPTMPLNEADKVNILDRLASSSAPAPAPEETKQEKVLDSLQASSTPVTASDADKLKILQSLSGK